MKKLLLLGLPAIAVAGLQVWSQALAEPAPAHMQGASPATGHRAFDDGPGLRDRREGAASLTGADNRGVRDGR